MSTWYDTLKQSPLAKRRDEAEPEEVAMWMDLNGMSTRLGVIRLLREVEKNYHNFKTDKLSADRFYAAFAKMLRSSALGMPLASYDARMEFFSDNALYWVFKLLSDTKALDDAAQDGKLLKFAKAARDDHKDKMMTYRQLGEIKLPVPSTIDQGLYEVFAELVDILEAKLRRTSQPLQA